MSALPIVVACLCALVLALTVAAVVYAVQAVEQREDIDTTNEWVDQAHARIDKLVEQLHGDSGGTGRHHERETP